MAPGTMAAELVFYTHPVSRGQIVRWMLEEVGAPYRTEYLEYGPQMKAPEYRAINPMGKVPAIRHGEAVVTECAAILAYLADAFPQAGLAPPPGARADYYRWLFFAAGPLEAAAFDKARNSLANDEQAPMIGYGTYGETLDAISQTVAKGPYVAGDAFSAADVYLGSHLNWGMGFGTIEKRPEFEAYVAPLLARPAYKRGQDIDNAAQAEHAAAREAT